MKQSPQPTREGLETLKALLCEGAEPAARDWFRCFSWEEKQARVLAFLQDLLALNATLQEFWLIYEEVTELDGALEYLSVHKRRHGASQLSPSALLGTDGRSLLIM